MSDKKDYFSYAPKRKGITLENGEQFPIKKSIPGDSVNEHENLEEANSILAEGEIKQQRENL